MKSNLTRKNLTAYFFFVLMVIILIFSLFIIILPTTAAGSGYSALDDYIQAQMNKHGIQGVSIAIIKGNNIDYFKGYGSAGKNHLMSAQTPMYIGSQSKSFTGLAVAQLAEQGKIDLAAPVQAYLPWFSVADPAASEIITVNHLLHHTSGLSDAGFSTLLSDDTEGEEAVRALSSAQLTAPVGTKHQYFNMGYAVLALVIEEVSGQPYETYIQEHIFSPLQMNRSYSDFEAATQAGLAQGYSRFFGFTIPQQQPHRSFEVAAGYLISTAEDLAHYSIAMLNGGLYDGNRVISEKGMRMVFQPVQGYGMGWYIQPGHIYHGGANETFKTFIDLYPDRDLAIVLLINQGYMVDHFISAGQIFSGVEALVLGKTPAPVSAGLSVKWIGWGLLILVLGLIGLNIKNFWQLLSWQERSQGWSRSRLIWDILISFLIPSVILMIVFSQIIEFWGDRFNWTYQIVMMFATLPDISILMIVGTVPDYLQGMIKLGMVVKGRLSTKTPFGTKAEFQSPAG